MRYEVRFSNGAWKAFDTVNYRSYDIFRLQSEAVLAVAWLNANRP
jgi:hypothetical protein